MVDEVKLELSSNGNNKKKSKIYDIAIIGAGIVGSATARAIALKGCCSVVVVEAENRVAAHQTGNNSGVIHSGLYYKPGSLKAALCIKGREALYDFCEQKGIAHDRCGKVVVATNNKQIPSLRKLEKRGLENKIEGIKRLSSEEINEKEPHVSGVEGLLIPVTGIVDYKSVTKAYVTDIAEHGGTVLIGTKVKGVKQENQNMVLITNKEPVRAKNVINCAGLRSDLVARKFGLKPEIQIIPFRGEYYELVKEKRELVKNLIYPVPDDRFPFLGVHFTRMIDGSVDAGPNAVLAFKREGYSRFDFSLKDTLRFTFFPGFWRLALKYWKIGFGEMYRSFSKRAFVKALRQLIPEIQKEHVFRSGAGVRAQALDRKGKLLDDFHIIQAEHEIHVLNAPSPAATASLAIGEYIANLAQKQFNLNLHAKNIISR